MKRRIIRTIGIIAAIIVVLATVEDLKVPGLALLSLSVMILSLVYDAKEQFKEGKIHKKNWKLVLVSGISAGGISFIGGMLKIIDFLK